MTEAIKIKRVMPGDNLADICAQTRPELWAPANEMEQYDPAALAKFLDNPINWLVIALAGDQIVGVVICYELFHPTGKETTLYVHELDTRPDFLRRGVATKLMKWLIQEAKKHGLSEVWLGTEPDNSAANALYASLGPNEIETEILYNYSTS